MNVVQAHWNDKGGIWLCVCWCMVMAATIFLCAGLPGAS